MFGGVLKISDVIIVEDGRGNSGAMSWDSWELRSQRITVRKLQWASGLHSLR